MRISIGAVAMVWLSAWCAHAASHPNPHLDEARIFYEELAHDQCVERLQKARELENSTRLLAQIELYSGLCKFYLGKEEDAQAHLRIALRLDPAISLPEFTSPRIVTVFEREQRELASTRRPRPDVQAPPAAVSTVDDAGMSTTPGARGRSLKWPLVAGGVALVSASGGTYFGVQAKQAEHTWRTARYDIEADQARSDATRNALYANAAWTTAGVALTTAVLLYVFAD